MSALEDFEETDFETATEEFEGLADNVVEYPEEHIVWVHRGDVSRESFRPKPTGEKSTVIVIDGNLNVAQALELSADQDDESGMTVFVTGSVTSRDILLRGDPFLIVRGAVAASGLVVIGGGNLGHIRTQGDLRCSALLQFTDGQAKVKGATKGAIFAKKSVNVTMPSKELSKAKSVIRDEYLDEDGEPDQMKICRACARGEAVLR
jgi:hypothetical protein